MQTDVKQLESELQEELSNILRYWQKYALDYAYGGFCGQVTNENVAVVDAPKGCVLNSRILWTFSAAYNHTPHSDYLRMAERAYHYVQQSFRDKEYGGVYWSVDYLGKPFNDRKQIYGLAFTIYGLSEYYRATQQVAALEFAQDLFFLIERHSLDTRHGGYFEAFARDWSPLEDLRLSAKDANEKKTMNTHLHTLEAYTNLYRIWPDALVASAIRNLIEIFLRRIVNPVTQHLHLFLDEDWTVKSNLVSYGHDIEASWLLQEAAHVLHDPALITQMERLAVRMARATVEGLDAEGGLNYELDRANNHLIREKHWWVQAEAMVGFLNAWQLTGEKAFWQYAANVWAFTKRHLLDTTHGEWFWGVTADLQVMANEDKIGFWKCPYHNVRACLEMLTRLRKRQSVDLSVGAKSV